MIRLYKDGIGMEFPESQVATKIEEGWSPPETPAEVEPDAEPAPPRKRR